MIMVVTNEEEGESKRRWTAFDSLPRRKYPVDVFKEENTHSETIRRPNCGNSKTSRI